MSEPRSLSMPEYKKYALDTTSRWCPAPGLILTTPGKKVSHSYATDMVVIGACSP